MHAFEIAAGILLAAFVILLLRLGMNIFRNNHGVRGIFGAAMFVCGLFFGWVVLMGGVSPP